MTNNTSIKNLHLIWAQDIKGGIGKDGDLPWTVPEDLKNFKKITIDTTIIMGRKTWESLPFKPLPKRKNIVISSSKLKGIDCYHSIESCLDGIGRPTRTKPVFIIGGRKIYHEFFKFSSWLHITQLNNHYDADTFFPFSMKEIEKKFKKTNEKSLNKFCTYSLWRRIQNGK
tara:strand:- start:1135 stop:1647 length:513 start_codon:yes stop_codon:yes gene_type:complete